MMNMDLISGIELTISASIMVVVISAMMGKDLAKRVKIASTLGSWFVIVVIVAAIGLLHNDPRIGTPGLGLAVTLPIVLMWVALMRVPSLRQAVDAAPLAALVGVHVVRVLGVSFLLLQANGRLPAPFAPAAGWGDIAAGLAAIPIAFMVHRQSTGWRGALLAWNLFGAADLIVAIGLGVLSSPGPLRRIFAEPGAGLMTTLPWLLIPGYLVPLLFVTHLVIFRRLIRSQPVHALTAAVIS